MHGLIPGIRHRTAWSLIPGGPLIYSPTIKSLSSNVDNQAHKILNGIQESSGPHAMLFIPLSMVSVIYLVLTVLDSNEALISMNPFVYSAPVVDCQKGNLFSFLVDKIDYSIISYPPFEHDLL